MDQVGRWVYGIDLRLDGGLPTYSEETYSTRDDALRGAIQKHGLDAFRFTLVTGRLVAPSPPEALNASRILMEAYKGKYDNFDAVLYIPGCDNQSEESRKQWREEVDFEGLEDRLLETISDWLKEPSNKMNWTEIVEEADATYDDISRILNRRNSSLS